MFAPLTVIAIGRDEIGRGALYARGALERDEGATRDGHPAIDVLAAAAFGAGRDVHGAVLASLFQRPPVVEERRFAKAQPELAREPRDQGRAFLALRHGTRDSCVDPPPIERDGRYRTHVAALTDERRRRDAQCPIPSHRLEHDVDGGEEILRVTHRELADDDAGRQRARKTHDELGGDFARVLDGLVLRELGEEPPASRVCRTRAITALAITIAQRIRARPGKPLPVAEVSASTDFHVPASPSILFGSLSDKPD